MQILGNIFYIILFVTVVGSLCAVLSLLANRVFHFALPFWYSVCSVVAYIFPILAPGLYLFSPEKQVWPAGYYMACFIWVGGFTFFLIFDSIRSLFARKAINKYKVCDDDRINRICARFTQSVGLRNAPAVYYGTLDDPACVVGVFRPTVILRESIVKQLSDTELMAVLGHEITHIRRGHIILERIYDYACMMNWFNPLAWIAKKDFAVCCEIDCDQNTLRYFDKAVTDTDYTAAMLHLLELSAVQGNKSRRGMSALGFLIAKRRIEVMTARPLKRTKVVKTVVIAITLISVILFSIMASRQHFYPYPAFDMGIEYAVDYGA